MRAPALAGRGQAPHADRCAGRDVAVARAAFGGLDAPRAPDLAAFGHILGRHRPTQGELLGYLLFDREFIEALIKMGVDDANACLNSPPGPSAPWQVEPLDAFGLHLRVAPTPKVGRAPEA